MTKKLSLQHFQPCLDANELVQRINSVRYCR